MSETLRLESLTFHLRGHFCPHFPGDAPLSLSAYVSMPINTFKVPLKKCVKPRRHFLLAPPRPRRLHAVPSVNLKLFSARFIINVPRCFSLALSARRRAATSSRGRVAGTRFCAVPPHLLPPPPPTSLVLLLLLITVILQLATLAGERTASNRFRCVTQRVCSHARQTLVAPPYPR